MINLVRKNKAIAYVLLAALPFAPNTKTEIGITNKTTGGWFGDNILHYIKTKWLAYKYNLTFYFRPFDNAHLLSMSVNEPQLPANQIIFNRHLLITREEQISHNLHDGTLLVLEAYSPGVGFETENLIDYLLLNSPQGFIDSIRPHLQPTKKVALPALPENMISVGVHIRKPLVTDYPLFGMQEFDTSHYTLHDEIIPIFKTSVLQNRLGNMKTCACKSLYADINEGPLKFPPTQYYIDQIRKLSEFLDDAPMFVHLFSCLADQTELYETIKKGVNKNNIVYAHDLIDWQAGLIEDMYALSSYDCLIKSISTFSSISQLIGDHAICIVPGDFFWDDKKLVINKSSWLIRQERLDEIKKKKLESCHYE